MKKRPWYDNRESIQQIVSPETGDLWQLNELKNSRQTAGYDRHEQLEDYIILGRFFLDSCGNFSPISPWLGCLIPELPLVITRQEFQQITSERHIKIPYSQELSKQAIPDTRAICPHCQKKWDLQNCHDLVVVTKSITIPLSGYCGYTLAKIKKAKEFVDGHAFHFTGYIYNDAHDKNTHNGRRGPKEGIDDSYIIKQGDAADADIITYFHNLCHSEVKFAEYRQKYLNILQSAGFYLYDLIPIRNEYCDCELDTSWFLAKTDYGTIKLGWRKHVINIDVSGVITNLRPDMSELFIGDNTTKSATIVHAWGWEKAQEYLTKIRQELNVIPVLEPF